MPVSSRVQEGQIFGRVCVEGQGEESGASLALNWSDRL